MALVSHFGGGFDGPQEHLSSARKLAAGSSTDQAYAILNQPILDSFPPWRLASTTVLVLVFGALGAAAGIGGGGFFVPLYAFLLGVGAKAAVPMSKATILGGAIG